MSDADQVPEAAAPEPVGTLLVRVKFESRIRRWWRSAIALSGKERTQRALLMLVVGICVGAAASFWVAAIAVRELSNDAKQLVEKAQRERDLTNKILNEAENAHGIYIAGGGFRCTVRERLTAEQHDRITRACIEVGKVNEELTREWAKKKAGK